jgi:ABC-type oligopeptide transport system ATPase subunit
LGESGSGKTTTGRAIIRLQDPTSGNVNFEGKDIASIKKRSDIMFDDKERRMVEITPNHFVKAADDEIEEYRQRAEAYKVK